MCRYGLYGPYKEHRACFDCRKSFKWPRDAHRPPPEGVPPEVKCPQCGGPMVDLGLDFKPPSQRDVRQWEKVRVLYAHGYVYRSCGDGGPGYRPRTLSEVPAFLARQPPRSQGEALLRRIAQRRRGS